MRRLKVLAAMAALSAAVALCQKLCGYLYRDFIEEDARLTCGDLKKERAVALDAGHGGFDSGKIGVNNVKEKDVNLQIAKKLEEELKSRGVKVYMTRADAGALAGTKAGDMKRRVEIINASGADLAVSIHQNSYTSEAIHGAQVFYYARSKEGELAAHIIQEALLKADPKNTRRPKANDSYYLLKNTSMPAVIVECGFLSNFAEAEKLTDPDYQKALADAAADGIIKYLNSPCAR